MILEDIRYDDDDLYSISSQDSYYSLYINEIYDLYDEIIDNTFYNPHFFHGVNKINFHDFIYNIIHSHNIDVNNFYLNYMKKHHIKYNKYCIEYDNELSNSYNMVNLFSKHFKCTISHLAWASFCFYHNISIKV